MTLDPTKRRPTPWPRQFSRERVSEAPSFDFGKLDPPDTTLERAAQHHDVARQAAALLDSLPKDPVELAVFFVEHECRGPQMSVLKNPVARWLQDQMKEYTIGVSETRIFLPIEGVNIATPDFLKTFLEAFNIRTYPELLEGAAI